VTLTPLHINCITLHWWYNSFLSLGADQLALQTVIAYSSADATAIAKATSFLASFKSRLVLSFWYRLSHVVLEKLLLNGCNSSSRLVIVNVTVDY